MSNEQDNELFNLNKQEEQQKLTVQRWNNVTSLQLNNTTHCIQQQQIQQTNGKVLLYFNDFLSKQPNTTMYPPERQYSFVKYFV